MKNYIEKNIFSEMWQNDKLKSYGIRTVKIGNSKLVLADGGAGFILYYSALGDVLYFLFPDI